MKYELRVLKLNTSFQFFDKLWRDNPLAARAFDARLGRNYRLSRRGFPKSAQPITTDEQFQGEMHMQQYISGIYEANNALLEMMLNNPHSQIASLLLDLFHPRRLGSNSCTLDSTTEFIEQMGSFFAVTPTTVQHDDKPISMDELKRLVENDPKKADDDEPSEILEIGTEINADTLQRLRSLQDKRIAFRQLQLALLRNVHLDKFAHEGIFKAHPAYRYTLFGANGIATRDEDKDVRLSAAQELHLETKVISLGYVAAVKRLELNKQIADSDIHLVFDAIPNLQRIVRVLSSKRYGINDSYTPVKVVSLNTLELIAKFTEQHFNHAKENHIVDHYSDQYKTILFLISNALSEFSTNEETDGLISQSLYKQACKLSEFVRNTSSTIRRNQEVA